MEPTLLIPRCSPRWPPAPPAVTPFLYWAAKHHPDAFLDITKGGNNYEVYSGIGDPEPCPYGYDSAPG